MAEYYNRYEQFTADGKSLKVPFAKIKVSNSDLVITYEKNRMRLDMLSYKYYADPNYAWLIMQANPFYGSMEFQIPDKVQIRIPYPLEDALKRYETSLQEYMNKNSID